MPNPPIAQDPVPPPSHRLPHHPIDRIAGHAYISAAIIAAILISMSLFVLSIYRQDPYGAAMAAATAVASAAAYLAVHRAAKRRSPLDSWIRRMGAGDLEYTIAPSGADDITILCSDLEQLRLSSIKAIQLDLVQSLSDQLQESNGELRDALAELTHTRDQAIAKEKLAGLGQIATGVAHEIGNPLNTVHNFTEGAVANLLVLQEKTAHLPGDADDPDSIAALIADIRDSLQRVAGATARATDILNRITALNSTATDADFQFTHLPSLINDQAEVAYLTHLRRNPEIPVTFFHDYRVTEAPVIPQQAARAAHNIITNALSAITERCLSDRDHNGAITLSTHHQDGQTVIDITDNGIGMTEETAANALNPFFSTRPSSQASALGLGLSIAHDIARQHRGSIAISSQPNSQTTVSITIPYTATQPTLGMTLDDTP